MAKTLSGQLESVRQSLTQFGKNDDANSHVIRTLRDFSKITNAYKNKYKSQPKVRKAILTSGEYADELASLLDRIVELDKQDSDHSKFNLAHVRAIFVIEALSLTGYDETAITIVEQWISGVRELVPVTPAQPSQLAGIFD